MKRDVPVASLAPAPTSPDRERGRIAVLVAGLAISSVFTSCAPHDAGFSDVRRTVRDRIGTDIAVTRRHESSVDPEMEPEVRTLLRNPLTDDTVVRIAVGHNRELRAALEDLSVAAGQLIGASLLPNPSIEGDFRPTVLQGNTAGRQPNFDVLANIDLTGILFLPARRGIAGAEFEAAKLRAAGRVLEIAYDARVAYYRYVAAVQTIALLREVLSIAAGSFETAQLVYEAGNVPELDVIQQQSLYEETRSSLVNAESEAAQERERLNGVLGLWGPDANWQSGAELADPGSDEYPIAEIEQRAIRQSLELHAWEWRIQAAARRIGLARAVGLVPRLDVGVSVVREDVLDLGPSLRMTLPIFSQNQGEVAVRRAELRRARAEYFSTAVQVRAEARAAWIRFTAARQQAIWYRDVFVPLRQRAFERSQLQFNAMQMSVFQLLQVRRDQVQAQRAAIVARREFWLARAALAQILAGQRVNSAPTQVASESVMNDGSGQNRVGN